MKFQQLVEEADARFQEANKKAKKEREDAQQQI